MAAEQYLGLKKIHDLSRSGEAVVFHFQVKALYDERELERLLEMLERRGAVPHHYGDGRHRLYIPVDFSWIPFYQSLKDCGSVDITDVTTLSQRHTIFIEPEG